MGSGRALWRLGWRHRLFTTTLIFAALVREMVLLAYQPVLLFNGDSYGYLANAHRLVPRPWRPIGYPLFLRLVLDVDRNLAAIALVQHAFGLVIGALVYALARRLDAGPLLATVAAAPVLFDAYQLDIEQFVMAEAVFELLVVGALVLLVWRPRPSLAACAASGALLAAAALTRTVGLVLPLPVIGYLLFRRLGLRRASVFAAAVVIPLVSYAGWFRLDYGVVGLGDRSGYFLYARVAPFASCAGLELRSPERVLCDPRPPAARPGPNFYLWRRRSPIWRLPTRVGRERNAILSRFARRVIINQPTAYLRTVVHDVLHYFEPARTTSLRDEPLRSWQFRPRFPDLEHAARLIVAFDRAPPVVSPPLARFLRGYQRAIFTPGPLLALAAMAGMLGLLGTGGTRGRGSAEGALLAFVGLALVVAAAAGSMFDYRYLLPALPLLPPAGVLGVACCVRHARSMITRHMERPRPVPFWSEVLRRDPGGALFQSRPAESGRKLLRDAEEQPGVPQ